MQFAATSGTNTEASTQYKYEIIDSSRAKITIHCPDIAQELEIPTSISVGQKKYTVTSISSNFRGCSKFFGILNLPDDVTEIEGYVFFDCRFNGTLKLSEKLEIIRISTFEHCDLFWGLGDSIMEKY